MKKKELQDRERKVIHLSQLLHKRLYEVGQSRKELDLREQFIAQKQEVIIRFLESLSKLSCNCDCKCKFHKTNKAFVKKILE